MKNIIFILTLSLSFILNAQVGINTINPKSTLDIRATNQATPNSKDGVLLTKIDMFPVSNPGIDQNSMLVYLTTDLTNINISGTPQDYTKGFYYWDNSIPNWVSLAGEDLKNAWELEGNLGTDGGITNFIGTKDNEPISFRTNNVERVKFGVKGNVETFQPGNTVAIGRESGLLDDGSDNRNTFIGDFAGQDVVGADTAIQFNGLALEGSSNVGIGYQAMQNNQSGWNNTAIGYRSQANTTGVPSSLITYNGVNNTSIGWSTLEQNLSGSTNVAIGNGSMSLADFGDHNLGVGSFTLAEAAGAEENVAVGAEALRLATNSTGNVSIGFESMTRGIANRSVAIGDSAGLRAGNSGATTYSDNISIGYRAAYYNSGGANNVAIGSYASEQIFGNVSNTTAIGNRALTKSRGEDNIAIGSYAGSHEIAFGSPGFSDHGFNNIYIGKDSGRQSTVNNSVFIGTSSGINEQTTDNILVIEHSARTGSGVEITTDTPLVYGEFDNNIFRVGGQLQIGSSNGTAGSIYSFPTTDGISGQVLTTDGSGSVTWQNGGSGTTDNIYTADGTLSADRTVTFNGSDLSFNNRLREFSLNNGNSTTSNNQSQLLFSFGGTGALNRFRHGINTQHNSGARLGNNMRFMLWNQGVDNTNDLPTFESLKLDLLETVFNDGGSDVDFRVESNTHIDAFNISGANGRLQAGAYGAGTIVGTATSLLGVDVNGNIIEQPLNSDINRLIDQDLDTQIQVEESADEDLIRFDVAGIEHFVMTEKGQLEFTSDDTVKIGLDAGENLPANKRSLFVGHQAGSQMQNNFYNTGVGYRSMASATGNNNSGGRNSTAFGAESLENNNGSDNVAVGFRALRNNTTGINNTAVGAYTMQLNTTGYRNTAIGRSALTQNTVGFENTALGYNALNGNTGNFNTSIGSFALSLNTTGHSNTSIGQSVSQLNTTGYENTAVGRFAGYSNSSGFRNTAIGRVALYLNSTGEDNVAIGEGAGYAETGSRNTYIGRGAGGGYPSTDPAPSGPRNATGNVMIGNEAGRQDYSSGNKLYIANSNTTVPLVAGDFSQARVGINTNASTDLTHTLTVGGDVKAVDFEATASGTVYADYVFEGYFGKEATINKDYKFTPLKDAITFVKENGHLPNVKSYKEVEANNFQISLTETSLKNLEKIEENFLYISELKSENDKLKIENKILEAKLNDILERLNNLEN